MSARIIVTLVCEYEGEDVDDYNEAMQVASDEVANAGYNVAVEYSAVHVLEVTVTG